MEYKADALLLRAVDYGENDKMVTLFTAGRGKIGAAVKGVKKAGAKLKFAAQPFCFAEYVFAEKAGRRTVTSASLHDGFYALREDVAAFYAASCVCETCDKLLYEGMVNGELLVAAVLALKEMCRGSVSPALLKFLCAALSLAGYPVEAGDCPVCGKRLSGRLAFDMGGGAFACAGCVEGVPASEITYRTVKSVLAGSPMPDNADGEKRALRLLQAYFTRQTDAELSSLGEYITMI